MVHNLYKSKKSCPEEGGNKTTFIEYSCYLLALLTKREERLGICCRIWDGILGLS
jgi:hypothetical protein